MIILKVYSKPALNDFIFISAAIYEMKMTDKCPATKNHVQHI